MVDKITTVASKLIMQPDGNAVLYDDTVTVFWSAGTNGNPGSSLLVQDDGNLVILSPQSAVLWCRFLKHFTISYCARRSCGILCVILMFINNKTVFDFIH